MKLEVILFIARLQTYRKLTRSGDDIVMVPFIQAGLAQFYCKLNVNYKIKYQSQK